MMKYFLTPYAFLLQTLCVLTFVVTLFAGALSVTDASSTTLRAGLQMADSSSCTNRVGTPGYTPDNASGGDSGWVSDAGGTDFSCLKLYSDPGPATTDSRMCVQVRNGSTYGAERCTPWASEGGGWSLYSGDKDLDVAKVRIENRPMPANQTITSITLGAQLAKGTGGACNQPGTARYTPASGGWSGWALDGSAGDADCVRVYLGTTVSTAIYPTVSFSANPATITLGSSSTLSWSSSNATSCTGSGFSTGNATSGNRTVSPSVTTQYSVRCFSSTGHSTIKYATVSVTVPSAAATLEVRNDTQGGAFTGNNLTINEGDQISIRWSSVNASSCAGSNFSTGGATGGTQSNVAEPTAGGNTTYTVICNGGGGAGSDAITVNTVALLPPSLSSTAEAEPIRRSSSATIDWNLNGNNPAQCSFSGFGVPASVSGQTGSFVITVEGETSLTLTCPSGSDTVTIEIVPQVYEE